MEHFKETRELLDSSNLFYNIATGTDGNYSYINSNYARQFSNVHGDLVGQPYYITMHSDDRKTCEEVFVAALFQKFRRTECFLLS